ncbi:MAG: isocitrate/isopropylmalate dehydrogenase family protein [Erysipelotrichaceae bacterium]
MKTVTLIKGDGIGPEIIDATIEVLTHLQVPLTFEEQWIGESAIHRGLDLWNDAALASIAKNKLVLKGPTETKLGTGFRSVNVALRKHFDLYANIRPIQSLPNTSQRYHDIDLIIFRENTEDLYVGVETIISQDEVHATKIITRKASERIIRKAFAFAQANNRKHVTCVHKANILKHSDGLFLAIFETIAKEYPDIESDAKIVDNMCMQLVMYPERYDVLVMPNLYGDILSDLASGFIGGLGLAPSSNIGMDCALFEAVHGSAPDIAGKQIANPTAMLLSACLLLDHLGLQKEAQWIRYGITRVYLKGKHTTPDVRGKATTSEFIKALIKEIDSYRGYVSEPALR